MAHFQEGMSVYIPTYWHCDWKSVKSGYGGETFFFKAQFSMIFSLSILKRFHIQSFYVHPTTFYSFVFYLLALWYYLYHIYIIDFFCSRMIGTSYLPMDGKLRLWNIPEKKVTMWNEIPVSSPLPTYATTESLLLPALTTENVSSTLQR